MAGRVFNVTTITDLVFTRVIILCVVVNYCRRVLKHITVKNFALNHPLKVFGDNFISLQWLFCYCNYICFSKINRYCFRSHITVPHIFFNVRENLACSCVFLITTLIITFRFGVISILKAAQNTIIIRHYLWQYEN